jgi:hypothetical protein
MHREHHRPRVGLVGTGLSGAILAELLNPICELVVFERGNAHYERASDITFTHHQPGWRTFSYGIGGTTNLWTGGLVEMLPGEFSARWPEKVWQELPKHYPDVVTQLYQRDAGEAWMRRAHQRFNEDTYVTSIYYPDAVFRVANSLLLRGCDVRQNCRLEKLRESTQGAELTFSQNGSTTAERFDFVILACGGLNSPIPLLRSGLGGSRVGLDYTDHPTGRVAKISGAKNGAVLSALSANTCGHQQSKAFVKIRDPQTGLWSAFYLYPAATLSFTSDPFARWCSQRDETNVARRYFTSISRLVNPDELYLFVKGRFDVRLPSRVCYVHAINEQENREQGSVTLDSDGRPSVTWHVSDATVASIERNLAAFADLMGAELHLPPQSISRRLFSGAHHSGTCRIASNPDEGVVDENLLVHGAERIYVCDGSVLPSTGASNTGLTIGALAHRLVDHLKSTCFVT